MGTLANISGKEAAKAFAKAGWSAVGQVGSHLIHDEGGQPGKPIDSQHRELGPGLLRSLIRCSGLSVDNFLKLL